MRVPGDVAARRDQGDGVAPFEAVDRPVREGVGEHAVPDRQVVGDPARYLPAVGRESGAQQIELGDVGRGWPIGYPQRRVEQGDDHLAVVVGVRRQFLRTRPVDPVVGDRSDLVMARRLGKVHDVYALVRVVGELEPAREGEHRLLGEQTRMRGREQADGDYGGNGGRTGACRPCAVGTALHRSSWS